VETPSIPGGIYYFNSNKNIDPVGYNNSDITKKIIPTEPQEMYYWSGPEE